MEDSILTSTKKILGIDAGYTEFDLDIITHINAVFSIITQLGVGPVEGFMIEDETAMWSDFDAPILQRNMVRTLLFLRVKMLFDPPTTSFLISAMEKQIEEVTWRLNVHREVLLPPQPPYRPIEEAV
jgi:hypothetical protein